MADSKDLPSVELYTDGGAEPNPGKGGYGLILSSKGRRKEFSQGYKLTTNNRMELMGVIVGLEKLTRRVSVRVFSDSKYVVDGIEQGWAKRWRENDWFKSKTEKVKNPDLWDRLLTAIAKHEVTFQWVKGHDGHAENERCDSLATEAMNSENLEDDLGYEPDSSDMPSESRGHKPASFSQKGSKRKVLAAGDACKKCSTPVERREPRDKKRKKGQNYYYEYYLLCPKCKTQYMVEDGKRVIDSPGLFD